MRSPTSSCKMRANFLKNGTNISIRMVSHRLSKEFGLKSYKPAAKLRLTSAMKKIRLCFTYKHLHLTVENGEQFYPLTNLQFNSLQCGIGTFKDQNAKDLMQNTPSVQYNIPKPDGFDGHELTLDCSVVFSCPKHYNK